MPRSSKALALLKSLPDDDFKTDDAAQGLQLHLNPDRALAKAVLAVAAEVADLVAKETPETKVPDYSKQINIISNTLAAVAKALGDVAGLKHEINALTKAVSEIQKPDLSPVVKALEGITKGQIDLAEVMSLPRKFTRDGAGEPNGTEIEWPN